LRLVGQRHRRELERDALRVERRHHVAVRRMQPVFAAERLLPARIPATWS
jgi:hypothetical protein